MIDVISVDNMRESDAWTIANKIPSLDLMGYAAQGIYDAVKDWPNLTVIVAGSGNNGGDGFALAEILRANAKDVAILTVSDHWSEDASYYKNHCEYLNIPIIKFEDRGTVLEEAATVVDCLLGTGFRGVPEGIYAEAIDAINESGQTGARVVSADINSGMNGDTGMYSKCVMSDHTVTIGYLKKGLITMPAATAIAKITVAQIGIDLVRTEAKIDEDAYGIDVITVKP